MASDSNRNSSQGGGGRSNSNGIARLVIALRTTLQLILWPFVSLMRFLLTGRISGHGDEYDGLSAAVTAKASQHFVDYLRSFSSDNNNNNGGPPPILGGNNNNNNNGMDHQAWLTTGFVAAQEQATRQQSLLLVYLHSPLHRSSETFCKHVLCHESMGTFINQPNITAFGVSVHTAQGAYLAQLLQASSFPFLALLQPKLSPNQNANNNNNNNNGNANNNNNNNTTTTTSMTLLLRAEGPALTELSALQIVPHLQSALQRHQSIVAEVEARRLQRQEESDLRRQQDEEYQAALLADQERERAQQLEAEQEAQRVAEAQRLEQEQVAAAATKLSNARAAVPEEPPAGTTTTMSTTTIRFVLPSGTKLNRRFYSHEKISGLLAFLSVHFHDKEMEMSENIGLSTNFPKKSYQDSPELTLEEAGLAPQAVLMVQDLDA